MTSEAKLCNESKAQSSHTRSKWVNYREREREDKKRSRGRWNLHSHELSDLTHELHRECSNKWVNYRDSEREIERGSGEFA